MLTLYRRHGTDCPQTSRHYRRCHCPIYVEGSLDGEKIRKGLDLTSWDAASRKIAEWNAEGTIGASSSSAISVSEAIEAYMRDARARGLRSETLRKLKTIFEKQFLSWAKDKGFKYVRQIRAEHLRAWRETWKDAPLAASKKLQRVRGFFWFCVREGWISTNPASAVRPPKVPPSSVHPFSEEDLKKLLVACGEFSLKGYGEGNRLRLRAMVLLLSQLRIALRSIPGVLVVESNPSVIVRVITMRVGPVNQPGGLASAVLLTSEPTDPMYTTSGKSWKHLDSVNAREPRFSWLLSVWASPIGSTLKPIASLPDL